MASPNIRYYEFEPFRIDVAERTLLRDGERVALTPKAFDALLLLVEQPGRTLDRASLQQALWPDTFVEENNLTQCISAIRKALGHGHEDARFIETVPRRGYRFVVPVAPISTDTMTQDTVAKAQDAVTPDPDRRAVPAAATTMRPASGQPVGLLFGVAFTAATLAIVGTAVFLRSKPTISAEGRATVRSVAVLPFTPSPDGPEAEALGMALADAVATRLKAAGDLQILVPTVSTPPNRRRAHEEQLLRAIGSDAVVSGRITHLQDRFEVSVELRRDLNGSPEWRELYAEPQAELDAVADAISREVALVLALTPAPDPRSLVAIRGTANPAAYHAYLRGLYFWNKRTGAGRVQSIPYFKEAIERDPAYSVAYAALADAYFFSGQGDKAYPLVAKALAIGRLRPEPYTSSAGIKLFQDWDWAGAEQDLRQAIKLDASYAPAWHWYALTLAATGRVDQALSTIEHALKLEPLSLPILTNAGWIRYFARQFDAAVAACRQVVDLDPDFPRAHDCLYHIYSQQGRSGEAIEAREASAVSDGRQQELAEVRQAFSAGGLRQVWKRDFASAPPDDPVSAAKAAARLGDREGALGRIEEGYRRRSFFLTYIKVDPAFDAIRSHPRFETVLRGMGLAGMKKEELRTKN